MSRTFDISRRNEGLSDVPPSRMMSCPRKIVSPGRQERLALAEEEVSKLVHRIFLLPETTQAPETVAFCGVEEGAGCSWVCARVGEFLAGLVPGTVCLVDLNLRSPSQHAQFGLEKGTGVTELMNSLRPVREFVRRTWVDNLWLVSAGGEGREWRRDPNPPQLRARLLDLRSEFDYLVIDTPPASSCADAPFLCQWTDGVVLVVGAHSTRRERARATMECIEKARVPILGAVLNRRTYPMPEALYRRL